MSFSSLLLTKNSITFITFTCPPLFILVRFFFFFITSVACCFWVRGIRDQERERFAAHATGRFGLREIFGNVNMVCALYRFDLVLDEVVVRCGIYYGFETGC